MDFWNRWRWNHHRRSGRRPYEKRDPKFRRTVLTAYERRCAICDFDVRLDDDLLGLDAAHIKWHAAGGPDRVPNGLALCKLHHHALDRGAIGLNPAANLGFTLLVSQELSGTSEDFQRLVDAGGATATSTARRLATTQPRLRGLASPGSLPGRTAPFLIEHFPQSEAGEAQSGRRRENERFGEELRLTFWATVR